MRRSRSAVLSLLLAAFLTVVTVVPAHASAGVPLPGPVDEILDIPSRLHGAVTASPLGNSTVGDMLKAQNALIAIKRAQDAATTAAAIPKPITPPSVLSRVIGGTALLAPQAGWALASNGTLALYGVTTGDGYSEVFCQQPGWYQGLTAMANLGFAPDCKGTVTLPNSDVTAGTFLTYSGVNLQYLGIYTYPNGFRYAIWKGSAASLSGGLNYQFNDGPTPPHWQGASPNIGGSGTCAPQCTSVFPSASHSVPLGYNVGATGMIRIRNAAGTVLKTATEANANPTRTPRCTVSGDGSSVTRPGTAYTEGEGFPMSAFGTGCQQAYDDFVSAPGRGPGFVPDRIKVESEDESGAITELSDQEVPDFSPDQRRAFEQGNGRGLVLEKVAGTVMTSCMTWAADCSGWWDATSEGTTTGTYRCTYAGREIALVECGTYRHTFDTQTSTPTITDPATGTQTPWTTQPSTGNSISPGTGPGTGANPTAECFSAGWSAFNPLEWVLTPVKCAFVWAFVPRSTVVDAGFASMESRWQSTAIGGLATAVAAWSFVAPSSTGCDGINVALSELGHDIEDFQILNACPGEPLQALAALSTLVIGIGAVLTAVAAVTGSVGGIVGQRALASGPVSS